MRNAACRWRSALLVLAVSAALAACQSGGTVYVGGDGGAHDATH